MPFDDRSTNLDLNGPNIEIKTDAYGHEEGSTTAKTTVNPFGDDASRTGGTIEITGIGTASWPTGFGTYASNTGTIGYQWYKLNIAGVGEALGISTRYEGQTTDTLKLKYLDSPADNLKQYYVKTRILPSAYAQPEGSTVTAGTARSTGFAINETVDSGRVTINVLPELTLDTQPTNQASTVNNNAEFNTSASVTDNSTISYQWYVDGNQVSDGDLTSTNFAQVTKEKYAVDTSNGRDNSITIPEDATNVKIRVGAGAGGYGGTDTNGQGGAGGYGRVGYFDLPDGGRTLTIRTGQRGSNANSGNNAQGGDGGVVTDDGDGGRGGNAPDSGAGGGGASGCYVYDSLTGGWIIAAGGGGGGGGGSWNVAGNAGANGGDWNSITGGLERGNQSEGNDGSSRSSGTSTGPGNTSVSFSGSVDGGTRNGAGWGYAARYSFGDNEGVVIDEAASGAYIFPSGQRDSSGDLLGYPGWALPNFPGLDAACTAAATIPHGVKIYVRIGGGLNFQKLGMNTNVVYTGWFNSEWDPLRTATNQGSSAAHVQFRDNFTRVLFWRPGISVDNDAPTLALNCSSGKYSCQILTDYDPGGSSFDAKPLLDRTYSYAPYNSATQAQGIYWEHDPTSVIRTDGGGGGGGGGGWFGGAGGSAGIDNPPPPPPPPPVGGCTDGSALNYQSWADYNDGSCKYPKIGCMTPGRPNYDPTADTPGPCDPPPAVKGCTDPKAKNYDPNAEVDDGTCQPITYGCCEPRAKNYDPNVDVCGPVCQFYVEGCTDPNASNYDANAELDNGSCTYPDDDDDDEEGCFVGGARVLMRSPTIILSDNSSTEETKPISEVKVGDYVMNKDKTEANKVVFVEKMSASDKELYAPKPDEKPFASKNHMLYVDGKWVNADGDQYPWLEDCELVSNVVIEPGGDQVLYNLWVTGDGSYIINGYGTHSIMFDGGFMKNAHDQGLLGYDDVLNLMNEFTEQKSDLLYGSFLVNRLLGKVNVKLLNRLWVNILCAEDSTKRKKAAHLVMKILQKIRRIV